MSERDELLAVLQQTVVFAEQVLQLSELLFEAIEKGETLIGGELTLFAGMLERARADANGLRRILTALVMLKPPARIQ